MRKGQGILTIKLAFAGTIHSRTDHNRTDPQGLSKERNAESTESPKRLQAKNYEFQSPPSKSMHFLVAEAFCG